jgi:hypothetical protein
MLGIFKIGSLRLINQGDFKPWSSWYLLLEELGLEVWDTSAWVCLYRSLSVCLSHSVSVSLVLCLSFLFGGFWVLNLEPTPWASLPALFCDGFFQDRVFQSICLDYFQIMILLISASWVARIIGMSHWCPTVCFVLMFVFIWKNKTRVET